MNELALFAGAGGGLLGTRLLGFRPMCAVEINPYRREVLLRRQEEGYLELFPVWDDVKTFDGRPWRGKVDIITAGFPCQPWSVAGKQRGERDDRNLWPDTIRIIRDIRPQFALLENVLGLKAKEYFGTILADLATSGFHVRWDCVRASDCGAPHRRDRLWILAYTDEARLEGLRQRTSGAGGEESVPPSGDKDVGDSYKERKLQQERKVQEKRRRASDTSWWQAEPDVGGSSYGLARQLDEALSETKEGPREMVQYLWSNPEAQTILERATQGLGLVQAEEVLLAVLCEYETGSRIPWEFLESKEILENRMRTMWWNSDTSSTSLRREQRQQLRRKYPNALRFMSCLVASRGKTLWSNPLWEGFLPRVVESERYRMDRIESTGEGQVPAVVVCAWHTLTEGLIKGAQDG